MTSYSDKGPPPTNGNFTGFDHIVLWVGNAKQAASYYTTRMGFAPIAYRGLETGHREVCSHVVAQKQITLVFQSPLTPTGEEAMKKHLSLHGDGCRDVAFTVDNARAIWKAAVDRGAKSVQEPWEESDEHGTVVMATIATYGDTVHTFVERKNYRGAFLPNYGTYPMEDPLLTLLPPTELVKIDHTVANQPDLEMDAVASYYEKVLQFHRFWSVDDSQIHTAYSSLRSVVMADYAECVKMPINEPALGRKRSQIQEYVDYYGGPGIQHVALLTHDIVGAVRALRARGTEFLRIPVAYYTALRTQLATSAVRITENLDTIQSLHILVDFDDHGYLLQIFTKPVADRPTLFFEIIQRHNHQGFGAGNFKSLFEAIEMEQEKRGNLD